MPFPVGQTILVSKYDPLGQTVLTVTVAHSGDTCNEQYNPLKIKLSALDLRFTSLSSFSLFWVGRRFIWVSTPPAREPPLSLRESSKVDNLTWALGLAGYNVACLAQRRWFLLFVSGSVFLGMSWTHMWDTKVGQWKWCMHFSHMWQYHLDMGNNVKMLVLFFFLKIHYYIMSLTTLGSMIRLWRSHSQSTLRNSKMHWGVYFVVVLFHFFFVSFSTLSTKMIPICLIISHMSQTQMTHMFKTNEASNGSFRLTSLSKEGQDCILGIYIYICISYNPHLPLPPFWSKKKKTPPPPPPPPCDPSTLKFRAIRLQSCWSSVRCMRRRSDGSPVSGHDSANMDYDKKTQKKTPVFSSPRHWGGSP